MTLLIIFMGFCFGFMLVLFYYTVINPKERKAVFDDKVDEMLRVLAAYKNGCLLESMDFTDPDSEWLDDPFPTWDFSRFVYRVKNKKVSKYT